MPDDEPQFAQAGMRTGSAGFLQPRRKRDARRQQVRAIAEPGQARCERLMTLPAQQPDGAPQRADQVPPDEREPAPGAYGAEMLTKKGVFGIVQGHQNRHLAIDPKTGALYVGVSSAGNLGVEPEPKATISASMPTARTR